MADTEAEIVLDEPEVKIEVADDKQKPQETKTAVTTADEGVEDLKLQVAKAREESARRLGEANRQIEAARRDALEAQKEVHTVRKDAVSTVIDSLTKDRDGAKRDWQLAMEAGDHAKAADAQVRISDASARIVEAERGKLELEAQPRPRQETQQVRQLADPVDEWARAAEQGGSHRSAEWIRRHPDFFRDEAGQKAVTRAHNAALGEDIQPDTDRYFAFVEDRLGLNGRQEQREEKRERETSRTPTAAPVSRSQTQSPGAQRPGTIRLSAKDVTLAMETIGPLYPNESRDQILRRYANQKEAAVADGQITRRDW